MKNDKRNVNAKDNDNSNDDADVNPNVKNAKINILHAPSPWLKESYKLLHNAEEMFGWPAIE